MIVKGDLNGDGRITIDDLIAIQMYILHPELVSPEQIQAGDLTGNGRLDISDLLRIRNHINGQTIINEVIY